MEMNRSTSSAYRNAKMYRSRNISINSKDSTIRSVGKHSMNIQNQRSISQKVEALLIPESVESSALNFIQVRDPPQLDDKDGGSVRRENSGSIQRLTRQSDSSAGSFTRNNNSIKKIESGGYGGF